MHQAEFRTDHLPQLPWHSFLAARQVRFLFLPIDAMPPVSLYGYLRELARRRQSAPQYERAFWAKAAIPFSMVALIMVAAPLAFGPPRSHHAGRNLALGLAVGIVFSLAQQIIGHLGVLLDLNPAAAALAPSVALVVLALTRFRDAYGLAGDTPGIANSLA